MRLWLDDVRPAPRGWVWVKTVDEMVRRLRRGGVTEVSLDHDLDYTDPGRNGTEVAVWLYRAAIEGQEIPVVHVHTANRLAGAQMAMYRQRSEHETGEWDRMVRAARRRVQP